MDVAHLGHLEMLTPKPDESLRFFVNVLGMTESGRQGDSVYLRGWDDYERHTLKLTASKLPGMGHVAFRARSPQALERRVAALKGSGYDIGWTDGDLPTARRSSARIPTATRSSCITKRSGTRRRPSSKPALKNQAQRFPARGVQRAPPGSFQRAGRGHRGQSHVFREISGLPAHRADRAG